MVKLLRLTSPEPKDNNGVNGSWENFLNDGIRLKEYSKIGLKSAVLPLTNLITIDDTNDRFNLKCKATNALTYTVILTQGKYSLGDFLDHVNERINDYLNMADQSTIGIQINAGLQKLTSLFNATSISYYRVVEDIFQNPIFNNVAINQGVLSYQTHANPQANDAFAIENGYMIKGCGYLRTSINTLGEFRLALVENFQNNPTISADELKYFCGANDAGNYYYLTETGSVESTEAAQKDDVLSIEISNRFVRYVFYRSDTPTILYTYTSKYDIKTDYRPCVLLDADGVNVDLPTYVKDPSVTYNESTDELIRSNPKVDNFTSERTDITQVAYGAIPSTSTSTAGKFTLTFSLVGLQRLFGYFNDALINSGGQYNFISEEVIDSIAQSKGVIIEIPSLPQLESYDTSQYKRRPILSVIPSSLTYTNKQLIYETSHPLMLDINNSTPLLLRNILINVFIDADDGEEIVNLSDQAELVVILE